jgi:hypothetical protein
LGGGAGLLSSFAKGSDDFGLSAVGGVVPDGNVHGWDAKMVGKQAEPKEAAPIANSGFRLPGGDTKPSFKLPAAVKKEA